MRTILVLLIAIAAATGCADESADRSEPADAEPPPIGPGTQPSVLQPPDTPQSQRQSTPLPDSPRARPQQP